MYIFLNQQIKDGAELQARNFYIGELYLLVIILGILVHRFFYPESKIFQANMADQDTKSGFRNILSDGYLPNFA